MRVCFAIVYLISFSHIAALAQRGPIDAKATRETKALFGNMERLAKKGVMFGHQHAMEYGHGWTGDSGRSDVQSVTGSHPAVIGIDVAGLSGRPPAEIEGNMKVLRKLVIDTRNRGGITTISWHMRNPASEGDFYWKEGVSKAAVPLMLPGGSHYNNYKEALHHVADLANSSRGQDGRLIPMVFRPFHEMDGDWFWWGKGHCSSADFVALWRFTVHYLRDSLGVHNFLYAFSPDNTFKDLAGFLERYPGNDYVDMLGMDNYGDMGRDGRYDTAAATAKLKLVGQYAMQHKKLMAFTETGLESIVRPDWWTSILVPVMQRAGIPISYVLVWRNDAQSPTHYYAPFPGHSSAPDFLNFYTAPYTIFEKDLPNMYK